MARKIKRKTGNPGERVKTPEIPQLSSDDQHPIFCLRYLSNDKDFSLSDCTKEQKAAFIDQLALISQVTWRELRFSGRHGMGYEKITRESIKSPIPTRFTEEITHFIAFRYFGKAPMVGHKENDTFHILWLDSKFKLYAHG